MAKRRAEKDSAAYLRKLYAYQALLEDLTAPEKVVARARTLYPDVDSAHALKAMREQADALAKELVRKRPKSPLRRTGDYGMLEGRPFTLTPEARIHFDPGVLSYVVLQQLTPRCPDLKIGLAKASGFRHYHWVQAHEASSWDVGIFWPHGQYPSQFPNATFSGAWSGETGAWFVGWLQVYPKRWWWDPYDMTAHAGVLQFTLPAPDCDSIVYWGAVGNVYAIDWRVSGDPGWIDSDWLLYESPTGANFPGSIYSYEFFADGAFKNDRGDSTTYDGRSWNRSFHVKAGVSARIYLGVSFMFWGRNGKMEVPGLQSYFDFRYGVVYFMVPG